MAKPKGPVLPRNLVDFVTHYADRNKLNTNQVRQWLLDQYHMYRDEVKPHENPRKSLGIAAGLEISREDLFAVLVHLFLANREDASPKDESSTAAAQVTSHEEAFSESMQGHLWFGLGLALLQDKAWREAPITALVSYLDDNLPFKIEGDYRDGVIAYLEAYANEKNS